MKLFAIIRLLATIIISLCFRVEVINMHHVPAKGSALLCANHLTALDMFLIGYRLKRKVHYMAKEELFRNPILAAVLKNLGAFPVRRGTGDVKAVKTALKLLEKGHIVGIFPEGHRRSKSGGDIRIKPGSAMFAIKSGADIIPVALTGCHKLFGRIKVVFGQPFTLDVDKNRKYTVEEMTQISKGIMDRIYSIMEAG
jgi:1-acyl-sn-glycerol-3-phosphate acyltransferase